MIYKQINAFIIVAGINKIKLNQHSRLSGLCQQRKN